MSLELHREVLIDIDFGLQLMWKTTLAYLPQNPNERKTMSHETLTGYRLRVPRLLIQDQERPDQLATLSESS